MLGFVDDDDFKALARSEVDLLRLRGFFEEVLDYYAVVVADVAGGDFEVVVGGDYVELDFAVAAGDEDAGVDADLRGVLAGGRLGEDEGGAFSAPAP